jgi:hypothetical protein
VFNHANTGLAKGKCVQSFAWSNGFCTDWTICFCVENVLSITTPGGYLAHQGCVKSAAKARQCLAFGRDEHVEEIGSGSDGNFAWLGSRA